MKPHREQRVHHALIVDDDAAVRIVLEAVLKQAGLDVVAVETGEAAVRALAASTFDVVLSDVRMPGMSGVELLKTIAARWAGTPVILLTAYGTVPLAVEAMKLGAADFLLKPFENDAILFAVRKVLTAGEHATLPPSPSETLESTSPAMRQTDALLTRAAASVSTVLLLGESGTGKEIAARTLHERSTRRTKPFVTVHCAALPDALLESELFGYEKGAFTGAASRKPGRVELAEGGTLFFDEIGEITPSIQVKLLRLLQDRTYERLGGTETLRADVRFVAATHRNLEALVRDGRFREDLFYRLNVFPIRLPALRDRRDDIAPLAEHFGRTLAEKNGLPSARFDGDALARLTEQPWPGNVRQLQNFAERLVVSSGAQRITREMVESDLGAGLPGQLDTSTMSAGNLDAQRRDTERAAILAALKSTRNNRLQAARLLGVSRSTFYRKLVELQLDAELPH